MDVKGINSEKESFVFGNEVSFCLKYLKSVISLVSGNCASILSVRFVKACARKLYIGRGSWKVIKLEEF